jgi:hypothetical protein
MEYNKYVEVYEIISNTIDNTWLINDNDINNYLRKNINEITSEPTEYYIQSYVPTIYSDIPSYIPIFQSDIPTYTNTIESNNNTNIILYTTIPCLTVLLLFGYFIYKKSKKKYALSYNNVLKNSVINDFGITINEYEYSDYI